MESGLRDGPKGLRLEASGDALELVAPFDEELERQPLELTQSTRKLTRQRAQIIRRWRLRRCCSARETEPNKLCVFFTKLGQYDGSYQNGEKDPC